MMTECDPGTLHALPGGAQRICGSTESVLTELEDEEEALLLPGTQSCDSASTSPARAAGDRRHTRDRNSSNSDNLPSP
ncbi:phosphatidylinositol 4-kinase type 2-beta, partial [Tachysurus ichikawai]